MRKVHAFDITWQDARVALIAIGFEPLVTIGGAEHWVRDNQRCILYVKGDAECIPCDSVKLTATAFVYFSTDGEHLFANV